MVAPLRPRVVWLSHHPAEVIAKELRRSLKQSDCPVKGLVAGHRIELHPPGSKQHFWSPQLMIEMSETKTQSEAPPPKQSPNTVDTQLSGLFGPHPSVWTLYMSGYIFVAFSGLISLAFACGQLAMGHPPYALLILPGCFFGAAFLYYLSRIAQDLSHEQMHELQDFIQDRLDELGYEDSPSSPSPPA